MNLYYEEYGHKNSPPLIILHGFFASSRNWRQVAEKLGSAFHVYVLDQRNHGNSPHAPLMTYPVLAQDVLDFMASLQLERSHLLGHSMGGKVAMWLALNYPDRVDKLIVVDIAPVTYNHRFDQLIAVLKGLPLTALQNRKQAEELLSPGIPELSDRQFLLQNLLFRDGHYEWRVDLDIFSQAAADIAAFPDPAAALRYQGQTLFIAGADSDFVEPAQVSGLFPNAVVSVVPNAGHWVHVQQPSLFLEQVRDFLDAG